MFCSQCQTKRISFLLSIEILITNQSNSQWSCPRLFNNISLTGMICHMVTTWTTKIFQLGASVTAHILTGHRADGRKDGLLTFWVSKWLAMSNGALPFKIKTAPAFGRQRKSDNRGKWTSSSSTFPFATIYFYISLCVTVFIFVVIIECIKICACMLTCMLDMLSCFFS